MITFCGARFWYFVYHSYCMVYEGYDSWSFGMKVILIGYFIGLSLFNILVVVGLLGPRLWRFMNAATENDVMEQAILLQRKSSFGLTTSQTNGGSILFDVLDYNKRNKSRVKITKLPYRRTVTEPQFKLE